MRIGRRKGISYILEVAMMTLVVVALATVVLTWGLSQISNSRIALTGAVNDRINRMQETINIEDVQMLSSNSMRVYVRNTGSIQVLVDSVYINNANAPILGICPSGSFQSGVVSVSANSNTASVTLPTAEPSFQAGTFTTGSPPTSGFSVLASAGWTASLASYTVSSATAFTLTFSANAPVGGSTATWFTNYSSCAAALAPPSKLSLAINGVGAVDFTVSPTPVAAVSGTATGTQTGSANLVDTSGGGNFGATNYANGEVWITSGTGAGQCRTISSNTASSLTVNPSFTIAPVSGSSVYSVSTSSSNGPPVCSGNSYTVTVATNRGTTFTGSFTV